LLPIFLTALGAEAFLLRLARLLRILRLARLGRFSVAMSSISEAIGSRRHELLLSLGVAALVLVISSALLYLVEGGVQPDNFGSIPRAMWWSIVTLTTVGYGDVFPMTAVGRILAAITAVTGIGLIAMPAGILAASFSDAMKRQRETAG
jgi:voltage-gated potassium channel